MYIEKLVEFWFSILRSEPTLRRNMQSSWNSGVISGRASFKKVRAKTSHLNCTVFYIQDYRIRIMPWTANITKSQTVCSNWRENQPFWERLLEWAHGRGMREWRRLLAVYPFHLWQSFNQKMLKIFKCQRGRVWGNNPTKSFSIKLSGYVWRAFRTSAWIEQQIILEVLFPQ